MSYIPGYPGSDVNGGVATMISGGTGQPSVWTTELDGVTGIEDLYTQAGANLADGDIGIIDTDGTSIPYWYSTAARNFIRMIPGTNIGGIFIPETAKTWGFRDQDATTVDWDEQNYSYAAPIHTIDAPGAAGFVFTDALAQPMSDIGYIGIHRFSVAVGSTSTPIFDLRRDVSGTRFNLRLTVTSGFWHILSSSGSVSTGVAYSQGTEYSFEILYRYSNSRCFVFHNYSASPTSVGNTSITLPTTGGTAAATFLQNPVGELTLRGACAGHLVPNFTA